MKRLSLTVALVLALAAPAAAQGPFGPLNDLFALGQGEGQTPNTVPTMTRDEPPFEATPRADCKAGSKTEPDIQGRVPAGSADGEGFHCNVSLLAHQGNSGGFKVLRYTDTKGRECAYYDTALLFPLNVFKVSPQDSTGVVVLDMTDPAKPEQTDTLTELPMLSPHESLVLNAKRGLIAAVLGNPSTYPGLVSIYDASQDCRHPVLQSSSAVARIGHESGFSPDGNTFYATATAYNSITAIDMTDPKNIHPIWQGNITSHGMSVSDDGNRAYLADPGGEMVTLDVSEIQARKANPQAKEISRLTWKAASIPQNAIPFTRDGKPYILEFDEYTAGTTGGGRRRRRRRRAHHRHRRRDPAEGRLQPAPAGQPARRPRGGGRTTPAPSAPCRATPPTTAASRRARTRRSSPARSSPPACASSTSPTSPSRRRSPTSSRRRSRASRTARCPRNYAMSQPVVVAERNEIWYSDGTSGFYVLRLDKDVVPDAQPVAAAQPSDPVVAKRCASRRAFGVKVRLPKGARAVKMRARLAGKTLRGKQRGRYARFRIDLKGKPRKTFRVKLRVKLAKRQGGPRDARLPPLPQEDQEEEEE